MKTNKKTETRSILDGRGLSLCSNNVAFVIILCFIFNLKRFVLQTDISSVQNRNSLRFLHVVFSLFFLLYRKDWFADVYLYLQLGSVVKLKPVRTCLILFIII